MERKEMVRYIVAFIALMFILSMFYNFGRTPHEEKKAIGLSRGTAMATCKIIGYGTEVIVQPWTESGRAVAEELKKSGYIDYINKIENKGILVFSAKQNIDKIREAYLNEDVEVLAQASCAVNGLVAFSLQNQSESRQAPGNIKIYLDPFSKIGEEIDVDLVADISDRGIEYLSAQPFTRTAIGSADAEFSCYDIYAIIGKIRWEKRDLNLENAFAGINMSDINYTRNDAITFDKNLNQTEISDIEASLRTKGINASVYSKGIITNSTDRETIHSVIAEYANATYPDSYIILYSDGEKKEAIENAIMQHGEIFKIQKGCDITARAIGSRIDGASVYIPHEMRKMRYYIDSEKIPQGNAGKIKVKYELIGMVASSIEFIDVG